jgi:2-hydroxy fatty acid dioxygenase
MSNKATAIKVSDNPLDFGQFYFSYAKYHYNDTNKLIHVIFIPTILFTALGMLHYGANWGRLPLLGGTSIQLDIGAILLAILLPVYLFVDFLTGLVSTFFFLGQLFTSNYLFNNQVDHFPFLGLTHFQVMLYLHLFAWLTQFVGHGIFEKRAPALLDNMLLMFVAPFFMIFEVLNIGIGYKEKEVKGWNRYVALEIKQYRESKVKKRAE